MTVTVVAGTDYRRVDFAIREAVEACQEAHKGSRVTRATLQDVGKAAAAGLFDAHKCVLVDASISETGDLFKYVSDGVCLVIRVDQAPPAATVSAWRKQGVACYTYAAPRDMTSAVARVRWASEQNGVKVGGQVQAFLAARAQADLSRVDSALQSLNLLGVHEPKLSQVSMLMGTVSEETYAYDLVKMLRLGNTTQAVKLALAAEPAGSSGLLVKHFAAAAAIAQGGARAWCADAGLSDYAYRQAGESATNWGVEGCLEAWLLCAKALGKTRGPGAGVALVVLVAQLAQVDSAAVAHTVKLAEG